jgi:hypothetical protein
MNSFSTDTPKVLIIGEDFGGKSKVGRCSFTVFSGYRIQQCERTVVFHHRTMKVDVGTQKKSVETYLLFIPLLEALALPNSPERTTSEPTPI